MPSALAFLLHTQLTLARGVFWAVLRSKFPCVNTPQGQSELAQKSAPFIIFHLGC